MKGCLSGPNEPAYDSCFGTTVVTDTTPEMSTEMTTEAMTTGFTTDEVSTGFSTTEAAVTTGAPTTCDDFEVMFLNSACKIWRSALWH